MDQRRATTGLTRLSWHVVGEIPAQNDIELGGRVNEVVGKKSPAIQNGLSLFVLSDQSGIGRGLE